MRVQRKTTLGIIFSLFFSLFIFGSAYSQEPVRIGAILSETGSAKSTGIVQKNSLEMAVDEINRSGGEGGREIELIIQDDRSDPAMASLAAKKLLLEDRLSAVIGPTTSSNAMAVKELFETHRVPLIALGGALEIVTPPGRWVFKSAPSVKPALSILLSVIKGMDISRIGLIISEDGFGRVGRRYVMREAAALGLEVTGEISLRRNEKNVTGKLETLMGSSPDALLVWSSLSGALLTVRGVGELEIEEPIFMPPLATPSRFLKNAGPASEGIILPATYLSLSRFIPGEDPHKREIDRQRGVQKNLREISFSRRREGLGRHSSHRTGYYRGGLHNSQGYPGWAGGDRYILRHLRYLPLLKRRPRRTGNLPLPPLPDKWWNLQKGKVDQPWTEFYFFSFLERSLA